MAVSVNTSDRERVFAMLERPVVPPDNPREAGERCPESRLAPLTAVNLNFDLRDSASPGMGDAAHRYECVVGGLSDHHVDRNRIDNRSRFHVRVPVPAAYHPVAAFPSIDRID